MHQKQLICIVGPTAVGKTPVAIAIAQHFKTEVLSADSRQIFKEMKIGTAVPSADELNAVKHHFIQSHSIKDDYNAGQFENDALQLLEQLFLFYDTVVMVGGSGLYINAVCNGFDQFPETDKDVREKLNKVYREKGIEALRELLQKHDKEYYNTVDLNNPQRIIRALEVSLTAGQPYSSFKKNKINNRNFTTTTIGLTTEREQLYAQINNRVDAMMKAGLTDEVKSLIPFKHFNALQTVGYKELFDYFENKMDLQTAINLIKQNTRNFAKRQLTWFKKNKNTTWLNPNDLEKIIQHIKS